MFPADYRDFFILTFSMIINKKNLLIFVTCIFIAIILSCEGISTTPIKRIIENPRDYDGKPVSIAGEVADVFSLIVVKGFVVKDATGEMVVITDRMLPKKGSQIKVRGVIREAFSMGDQQLIVLVEEPQTK